MLHFKIAKRFQKHVDPCFISSYNTEHFKDFQETYLDWVNTGFISATTDSNVRYNPVFSPINWLFLKYVAQTILHIQIKQLR